jgi:hypothetical protein
MLKSYLKQASVTIEALPGERFDIAELSAADQIEIVALARTDRSEFSAALVCRLGVLGWREHAVEEIAQALTSSALGQLARKIYALSGVDLDALVREAGASAEGELAAQAKKNSLNGQAGDSSFASAP